jgi:hypothetical protein
MGLVTRSTRSCFVNWHATNNLGPKSHNSKGGEARSQRTKVTQGIGGGEGSSQDIIASCGPQGTAHCMMMRQNGRQMGVSLRRHVHEGLRLIVRWRPISVSARASWQSAGEAGQKSQGGDARLIAASELAMSQSVTD